MPTHLQIEYFSLIACSLSVNTGAPQGCVFSPVLYTLYTQDCAPIHNSNLLVELKDDSSDPHHFREEEGLHPPPIPSNPMFVLRENQTDAGEETFLRIFL